jgi:hypothetical protein
MGIHCSAQDDLSGKVDHLAGLFRLDGVGRDLEDDIVKEDVHLFKGGRTGGQGGIYE